MPNSASSDNTISIFTTCALSKAKVIDNFTFYFKKTKKQKNIGTTTALSPFTTNKPANPNRSSNPSPTATASFTTTRNTQKNDEP